MYDDLKVWLNQHAKVLKVMGILLLLSIWSVSFMTTIVVLALGEAMIILLFVLHHVFQLLWLLGFAVLLGFMSEARYCDLVGRCLFGRQWR